MILTNFYGYKRLNDFSAQGVVFDHKGVVIEQKTDLPIIVINWINGQMIKRESDALPINKLNEIEVAKAVEAAKLKAAQEAAEFDVSAAVDSLEKPCRQQVDQAARGAATLLKVAPDSAAPKNPAKKKPAKKKAK